MAIFHYLTAVTLISLFCCTLKTWAATTTHDDLDAVVIEAPSKPMSLRAARQFWTTFQLRDFAGIRAAANQPCLTQSGRLGTCTSFNKCYPYFKAFNIDAGDTWVMGSYDTCSYNGPNGRQIFGVCCSPGATSPNGEDEEFDDDNDLTGQEDDDQFPIEAQVSDKDCGKRFFRDTNDLFKIVSGSEANTHEFPFMAAMLNKNRQFCGGSLFDDTHILTAAHCVSHMSKYDVQNLRVNLGDHNLKSTSDTKKPVVPRKVKRVIRHKGFNSKTLHNDVAILTLAEKVKFDQFIQPICLQTRPDSIFVGKTVEVSGWGTTKENGPQSNHLRKVSVKVWSNQDCKESYGENAPGGITKHMICANDIDKDSCSGDSGGPLFDCNNSKCEQLGIVSWGIGCAQAKYPGVYTSVSKMIEWIKRIAREY